jgi:hypothetical protein
MASSSRSLAGRVGPHRERAVYRGCIRCSYSLFRDAQFNGTVCRGTDKRALLYAALTGERPSKKMRLRELKQDSQKVSHCLVPLLLMALCTKRIPPHTVANTGKRVFFWRPPSGNHCPRSKPVPADRCAVRLAGSGDAVADSGSSASDTSRSRHRPSLFVILATNERAREVRLGLGTCDMGFSVFMIYVVLRYN